MASPEFIRRNHEYVAVVMVLSEQLIAERGSQELRDLVLQVEAVCSAWSGSVEPERDETGGADIMHTAAFTHMIEQAGMLAWQQWPIPADCSPAAQLLYWPGVLALLVARADAAHKEL